MFGQCTAFKWCAKEESDFQLEADVVQFVGEASYRRDGEPVYIIWIGSSDDFNRMNTVMANDYSYDYCFSCARQLQRHFGWLELVEVA